MTRIVVHAGFHKTGTTSVQSMIRENRSALQAHVRCYLKPDFEDLTGAARAFSIDPDARRLAAVGREAADVFGSFDPDDPRPVLMSSEDLSGHLPGRHGLDRYDAAPLIMAQLADAARARFGDALDLIFFFSTRDRAAWLRSTWWQNLRSTRLTEDLPTYTAKIAAAADLPAILRDVAEAVAPATVAALPLEDSTKDPFGPLTPLLDLVQLPDAARAALTVLPPENQQPDLGLEQVFLALNRSDLRDKHVQEAKRSLRQMANRQLGLR
ncbi:hypothetical protein [Aestuariicoccus sp. MJ-SS9]|uniref:hypothetical protein n=1 Tax=Aestuariicoccus sp. MJ-SS9 TaxID=3079855 RepID=UPI002909D0A5|nr:hypothetical protein [Aestuariicoccus sp. MJ-SS9]MDU8912947.1 hypothetical protein [Aestuariicoccus sp. MJ-SS9]